MRSALMILSFLFCFTAQAAVISPSSVEVKFSFTTEFQTRRTAKAETLVLEQARHLFGYMNNAGVGAEFGLPSKVAGVGAPRWAPHFEVLADTKGGKLRTIRYEMRGLFLLHKNVAEQLLKAGTWQIELPLDLDHYYAKECVDKEHSDPYGFWYFYEPFLDGCERLRSYPLASSVEVRIEPAPAVDEGLPVGLEELRGDNGNGELFEITAISGFNESPKKQLDEGRVNFEAMNEWMRGLGFEETVINRGRQSPAHRFEKRVKNARGEEVLVRVTRILIDTYLDYDSERQFARFLRDSIESSDVLIYEGHSGDGASMTLKDVERLAGGKIDFNRSKRQLFFFDACSSYSYYLGIFLGKKDPGTLAVLTNGLSSMFETEVAVSKHFYKALLNFREDGLTWSELLGNMEKPLRGGSYLLNVDLNLEPESDRLNLMTSEWWLNGAARQ